MEDVNISDNTSTLIPAIIFSNNTKIITAKFYGQNISQGIYAIAAFGLSKQINDLSGFIPPVGREGDITLTGIISKKQHNAYGETRYIIFIPFNSAHYYNGQTTIVNAVIYGVTHIYNNETYIDGFSDLKLSAQDGRGFLVSFEYTGDLQVDGYLASVTLHISRIS